MKLSESCVEDHASLRRKTGFGHERYALSSCRPCAVHFLALGELGDSMLQLHKALVLAKTPNEKNALQRQIDARDPQIDQLVYELYGLTDEEIRIVEEATRG